MQIFIMNDTTGTKSNRTCNQQQRSKTAWNYRTHNRYRIRIPLEPLKDGYSMDPKERMFLEAAERGDKHTMIRCLQQPDPVNVNCTNILGRSALQIAVDNENFEIVELLLKQENVKIGDAVLYAIREGVYKIVEMLINHPSITPEMLANDWAKTRPAGEESSDYSPDISPVMLAAHCNQFEILQLLLSRGAVIETPHPLSCNCEKCHEGIHTDSLRYSLKRIHTYRALASAAWISLTSEDPILTAFKLSWELERLAMMENEFKEIYLELSEQCKKYSCDLLDQCRSTEEVIAVLNRKCESEIGLDNDNEDEENVGTFRLSRVKLALKYEQKQFVAHPNCQQLLTTVWYEGLPVWRRRNVLVKLFICLTLIVGMPIIAMFYLLCPHTKIGHLLRSPFMKFLYHSTSFACFLTLLILASTRTESSELSRQNIRGPPPSFVEWLIFFWVTGMVWSECKQLWEEGLKAYVRQWWNWLDFIMLSLYLTTCSLRAVAYFQIRTNRYGPREMDRIEWPQNDPTIIAEGVFAVANVFSFARIIYLFQTNPHLGPLQISLGCMIIDIAKFFFIFFLVLTSFACGLNQLYWYYDKDKYCDHYELGTNNTEECSDSGDAFMTIDASYTSLLWSLFGVIPLKELSGRDDQAFIKWIGHALLGAYLIMAMTVMINMLIAMMSRSFQDIEDHADREWKFARSKLWISYFDEGSTLPPPFNLIVSPKAIYYFIRNLSSFLSYFCARQRPSSFQVTTQMVYDKPTTQNGDTVPIQKGAIDYQDVMKRLVSRYIHQIKKQMRQDGVNEDDLLEIKQDISSLRYELREDRNREALLCSARIENMKRDILGALKELGTCLTGGGTGILTQTDQNGSPSMHPKLHMTPGSSTESHHYHQAFNSGAPASVFTTQNVDALRSEIVSSLRVELQDFIREIVQQQQRQQSLHRPQQQANLPHPTPPPPHHACQVTGSVPTGLNISPQPLPTLSSDLYQTHLYTQL